MKLRNTECIFHVIGAVLRAKEPIKYVVAVVQSLSYIWLFETHELQHISYIAYYLWISVKEKKILYKREI